MLPLIAPRAIIELAFDPIATIGDWSVRLETLAIAAAVFAALVVAALIARRTPVDGSKAPDAAGREPGDQNHLRSDDLLYIAVAALPGAVIGARLGYLLVHLDYYQATGASILDIGQGGLELTLGVVGGMLTAAIVAVLLDAPLGRWMHAAALPLLLVLAAGKAAMILGGSGQGQLSNAAWATAYVSPGPWGSLAPALPANPSQAYESIATGAVIVVMLSLLALGVFRSRNGEALLVGVAMWASARAIVATTWRDPTVLGPLLMDQVISISIAAGAAAAVVLMRARAIRRRRAGDRPDDGSASSVKRGDRARVARSQGPPQDLRDPDRLVGSRVPLGGPRTAPGP